MKKFAFFIAIFIGFITTISAQDSPIIGTWKVDSTSEFGSNIEIEIYKNKLNGLYYGKVKKYNPQTAICENCPIGDPRHGKKIMNMVIIKDLEEKDKKYKGGKILYLQKGKIKNCRIKLSDDKDILEVKIGKWPFKIQKWNRK